MDSPEIQELLLLGHIIRVIVVILITLSYITVSLRLWVRYRITRNPGWDDAAMVMTLMLFTIYCAFIIIIIMRGFKRDLFTVKEIRVTLTYVQLSKVFYALTTTMFKISLGLFFLRVLTKRWQQLLFYVLIGISTAYGLIYVLTIIFTCGNPTKIADTVFNAKKCLPAAVTLGTGYLYGSLNVIADWIFVLVPITVLMDSSLDRRSKISVGIIMALGAVGSVSSIMRMVYLKGIIGIPTGLTPITIKATIWATAEPGTGIIAASIAILRPLVRNVTTTVKTKAQAIKASKMSTEPDTIALTSMGSKALPELPDEDPWSPTSADSKPSRQRFVMIQAGDPSQAEDRISQAEEGTSRAVGPSQAGNSSGPSQV